MIDWAEGRHTRNRRLWVCLFLAGGFAVAMGGGVGGVRSFFFGAVEGGRAGAQCAPLRTVCRTSMGNGRRRAGGGAPYRNAGCWEALSLCLCLFYCFKTGIIDE